MGTRLNKIFTGMKQRCYNKKNKYYKDYGGRGITICKEWLDDTVIVVDGHFGSKGWFAFKEFSLSNGYASNLSIDRIDNNKGYSPENCRWVNAKVQSNNKRNSVIIEYKGNKKTLAQWAEYLGMPYETLKNRYYKYGHNGDLICSKTRVKSDERKISQKLIITYKGKTQKLSEWCRELNLNYPKSRARIFVLGWDIKKVFEKKGVLEK